MNCISLPGIIAISYMPCSNLPADLIYQVLADYPVTISGSATPISIKSIPVCELEESPDNNTPTEKVKLIFTTLDTLPTSTPLAFLISTVNNKHYIIGTHERLYPTIKCSSSTSKPDGEAASVKYEVSFTARKALIPYTV
ncbi:hypothetical protein [Prevotella sp. P6B1]|uniref:hypothetical protein n=1 Tax=Prevotella sp. P6B1 TaxID=1410613 RepID=UPI00051C2E90|nr:hypothetical protein [Prevotella sp. P6B1]